MCALAHVADTSQTFPEVRDVPEPEITTCPFRKSYLDVVVAQPGQDRDGDNAPERWTARPLRRRPILHQVFRDFHFAPVGGWAASVTRRQLLSGLNAVMPAATRA